MSGKEEWTLEERLVYCPSDVAITHALDLLDDTDSKPIGMHPAIGVKDLKITSFPPGPTLYPTYPNRPN